MKVPKLSPAEKLLQALYGGREILVKDGDHEPVEVKRDDMGMILSQLIETDEPRREGDHDIIVLSRRQIEQLVVIFQDYLREAH